MSSRQVSPSHKTYPECFVLPAVKISVRFWVEYFWKAVFRTQSGDTNKSVIRQTVQVLPGHRVEVVVPELNDGDWVEVVVNSKQPTSTAPAGLLAFIDSLPQGPRAAANWEVLETQLQQDRQSWAD